MRLAGAGPDHPVDGPRLLAVAERRTLDYTVTGPKDDLEPIGIQKQSFVAGLYGLGSVSGYYAPIGVDPNADLTQWYAATNAGEPYAANPQTAGSGQRDRAAPLVLLHPRHTGARAAAHLQRAHR
jgi:hypothetical protein